MTRKNASFEAFVPFAARHVRIGFNPVFQFLKIFGGNATFTIAFDKMIQGSGRQWLFEFGIAIRPYINIAMLLSDGTGRLSF